VAVAGVVVAGVVRPSESVVFTGSWGGSSVDVAGGVGGPKSKGGGLCDTALFRFRV
jgi:hypothetical protein